MIEQPDINQPILVVEDEPDTADLVKLILQKMAIRSGRACRRRPGRAEQDRFDAASFARAVGYPITSCRRHHYSGNDPSHPRLATRPGGPPDGCRRSALYPSGGGYQGPGLHPQTIYARRSAEMC